MHLSFLSFQGVIYVDENGYLLDDNPSQRGRGKKGQSGKRSSKYPKEEIDDKHLYAVSS